MLAILKCVWKTTPLFQARCAHKGEIIEIYRAGLRGETIFAQVLQAQLDADSLELPTVYRYFNELCGLVQFLNACFISGCINSTGDRVYRLFASAYFNSDQFVEMWRCGHQAPCCHVLLFWRVKGDSSTDLSPRLYSIMTCNMCSSLVWVYL